eukprot:1874303-Pleurochrysis_carterae.AAC.1
MRPSFRGASSPCPMPSSTASLLPLPCPKPHSFGLAFRPHCACSMSAAFARPSLSLTCLSGGPGSRVPRCSG